MRFLARLTSHLVAVPTAAALLVGGVVVPAVVAGAAAADVVPMQQRTETMPTAVSLPTVQINGVVWTQLIVGNTVFVGGAFTSARPAGSDPGVNEIPRSNILAYDLRTGELLPFGPVLNQQVKAIAVSPDGSRLYVGGNFTTSDGVARYRIAAYNIATGALVTSWSPGVDFTVNAILATSSTVYIAGAFSSANGATRTRFAAFSAATGALLDWAPTADAGVSALVMTPDGTRVVASGAFSVVNGFTGQPAVVALDAVTGALDTTYKVNALVKNSGANSSILSLSTDGVYIYGGGYKFGSGGNLEGMFKADGNTGQVQWIEDCHGDTYGVYASSAAVYQVGHAHYCGNVGGFPQPSPWDFRRATAFTKNATGTMIHETQGYTNWANTASPSLLSWYPRLDVGTYTGKGQAAWSVTGNDEYVVLGGEFPLVNGNGQQGLARFAIRSTSLSSTGAQFSGALYKPTLASPAVGTVRVTFPANWDRDDSTLTYDVIRNGANASPIYTTTVVSNDYTRPAIGFVDTGANTTGTTTYRLRVTDPSGRVTLGDFASIAADGSGAAAAAVTAYGQVVEDQGASLYLPLNESAGPARDRAGFNDAALNTGVTTGAAGVIPGDNAMTFSGATGGDLAASGTLSAPQTFSVSAWFKTNTTRGGRIAGFSDLSTQTSGHRDRQIYMNNTGRVSFGVWGLTQQSALAVTSAGSYNDNNWHQAVATFGVNGMQLFVDGVKVGFRADVTALETYPGYWRFGGDSTSGYPNAGSSGWFAGSIDDVAVYPTVLTGPQVNAQLVAAGRTSPAPADTYGSTVFYDDPTLYWRLGETGAATTAADSASGLSTGLYTGLPTKGVTGAVANTTNTAVALNGSTQYVSSNSTFANPTNYSVEAWFKTSSSAAQKIIGLGNSKTGGSTNYDRHVYLQAGGRLVFGGGSSANAVVTTASYNDGGWHHVVGTQGADGEKLYVDGLLVGANATATTPNNYTGYWRVGADRIWNNGNTVAFFNGTVDEVAVYPKVLSAAAVKSHFTAGGGLLPNVAPTAAFTSSAAKTSISVDASTSSDPDGTLTGYAWTFGDGGSATGITANHTYTAAGTYPVKLTVTDNRGGTASSTATITVIANAAPTASFVVSADFLVAQVDGSASADTDGSIAEYSYDFGDGTAAVTGPTPTATHSYITAGDYTVTLMVTDNNGTSATTTRSVIAVKPPNAAPVASFTTGVDHLVVSVDASTSSDSDGSVVSSSIDFGDAAGAMVGPTASHTYVSAGTYTVTVTVTDDGGSTGTATKQVTVAPNSAPVASFVSTTNGATVSVDGSASTDADGTLATFSWDFGDGTGPVTGATASHTYASLATYTVTLTVSDNNGATGSTSSSVALVPAFLVNDTFNRTSTSGWGTADVGGAWTVGTTPSAATVSGGAGRMSLGAGATRSHSLGAISQANEDLRVRFALDKAPAGGNTNISFVARKTTTGEYRLLTTVTTAGAVNVRIDRVNGSTTTTVRSSVNSGMAFSAGTEYNVRFMSVNNANGGVDLSAKIWNAASPEPVTWTLTGTDGAATALIGAGGIGLITYVSASATNAPVIASFRALTVQATA